MGSHYESIERQKIHTIRDDATTPTPLPKGIRKLDSDLAGIIVQDLVIVCPVGLVVLLCRISR